MELGYTLPQTLTSKVKLQKVRFFVNTYNLFSIDNTRQFGLDPEGQDEKVCSIRKPSSSTLALT